MNEIMPDKTVRAEPGSRPAAVPTWPTDAVMAHIALDVPEHVPVVLRGGVEGSLYLAIGVGKEITLTPSHVRELRNQCDSALRDAARVARAEELLDDVESAAAQARTAAERAMKCAAGGNGSPERASDARRAAQAAFVAAERAERAVADAFEAMQIADNAAESAVVAANATASDHVPHPV